MAQTGYTPISIYYSSTASNTPTAGNLVAGELAINTADGKLFYKDSGGAVQTLATKTAATFPNVNGSTSGAVTLAAPAVAGSNTATFPAATGTVMVSGNMPAFAAYSANSTTVTPNVNTKLIIDTESFDTNNNYTNSRFTPTVAGYYQINGGAQVIGTTIAGISLYKNGSIFFQGTYLGVIANHPEITVSGLMYFNGSTDYVELFGSGSASTSIGGGAANLYFNGCMIRTA